MTPSSASALSASDPIFESAPRVLIMGCPRCGKTTFSAELQAQTDPPRAVFHADDLIAEFEWSRASERVSEWLDEQAEGPWIIEGVSVVRGLRKWLARTTNKTKKPADVALWMVTPKVVLSPGQLRMAKGCITIWNEVREDLLTRGVQVRTV